MDQTGETRYTLTDAVGRIAERAACTDFDPCTVEPSFRDEEGSVHLVDSALFERALNRHFEQAQLPYRAEVWLHWHPRGGGWPSYNIAIRTRCI